MNDPVVARIQAFLAAESFAVVGASTDRSKYGNKVLRCYQQHGRTVYPINARAAEVEGLKAYASLADLPVKVAAIGEVSLHALSSNNGAPRTSESVKHQIATL